MLSQTSQKLSDEVQRGRTAHADKFDQTPPNIPAVLCDLTFPCLCLAFALYSGIRFVFDEAMTCP